MIPTTEAGQLRQRSAKLTVPTERPGFHDITAKLAVWLESIAAREGLASLFVHHTSASLTIQENADPAVQADLMDALNRIAPRNAGYRHASEGPDDMPAHIRAMLTSVQVSIPVIDGRAALGTWQGVYLIEHRDRPHERSITFQFLGACNEAPA